MIVDSSALVAILNCEPERERFLEAILEATTCGVAAPTVLETSIVLGKLAPKLTTILREFLREADISIIAFDEIQLSAAEDAHRRFGRGAGHPARLNFGDCFAYAAALVSRKPLLFKGSDFAQTDIVSALA